ncbi:hypothetical protein BH23PAT2_BH23PAT2_05640 [soil metagenome]
MLVRLPKNTTASATQKSMTLTGTGTIISKRSLSCFLMLFFYTLFVFASTNPYIYALSAEQRRIFASNILYYNAEESVTEEGCATALPGDTNEEKTWNYLINKSLTAVQAAGAMGNLKHEGGFNPKRVEDGWGFPSEMDTMPPNDGPRGQPGYGIVQWTSPGRKQGLVDFATSKGLPVHNLGMQLDYMWSELEGSYKTVALDPLMATNDLAEAVSIWQDKYEVGTRFEPRFAAAQDYLVQFGSGTTGGGSEGGSSCSTSGIDGVTCPANMEAHPTRAGYFKMPEAPNGEYMIYSTQTQRYGSQQLVCVLYTVAVAFNDAMAGKSKMRIGDLNASGHASHNIGIGVDLSGFGDLQVASHTKSWKGTYDKDATILLGKMFADTGVLRNIWWCDPGDDSTEQILTYAQTKGLEGQIECLEGHKDHFHVDIKQEFKLEFWEP